MKHRELFATDVYPPGRCVVCDERLPAKSGRAGSPRSTCCADAECKRAYWRLRHARVRELVAIGLITELKAARRAVSRANRSLRRA